MKPTLLAARGGDRELGDDRRDLAAVHRARLAEEARRQASSTAEGDSGCALTAFGVCRPECESCAQKWAPWRRAASGPFAQPDALVAAGRLIHDHIARPLEMIGVDDDVAGDEEPEAALAQPARALQLGGRPAARRREPLRDRGLGQAIGQNRPARQGKGSARVADIGLPGETQTTSTTSATAELMLRNGLT